MVAISGHPKIEAFSGRHVDVQGAVEKPNRDFYRQLQRRWQGLSTVEKPNRDFCHQLQDVGQTGLITVKGKMGWKNSCGDSTMEERRPIYTGVRGVLAGRLAGHKTMPASV
jgi:hypothetical protein